MSGTSTASKSTGAYFVIETADWMPHTLRGISSPLAFWPERIWHGASCQDISIKTNFVFKISLSESRYFQVSCLKPRNQSFYRIALNSKCKNEAQHVKNLGENGLFSGHFFQKPKREITVSSNIQIFCILEKISFF